MTLAFVRLETLRGKHLLLPFSPFSHSMFISCSLHIDIFRPSATALYFKELTWMVAFVRIWLLEIYSSNFKQPPVKFMGASHERAAVVRVKAVSRKERTMPLRHGAIETKKKQHPKLETSGYFTAQGGFPVPYLVLYFSDSSFYLYFIPQSCRTAFVLLSSCLELRWRSKADTLDRISVWKLQITSYVAL